MTYYSQPQLVPRTSGAAEAPLGEWLNKVKVLKKVGPAGHCQV